MAKARAVRFACGHCICCEACADDLLEREAACPSCRAPIKIVERGGHLDDAATFDAM